jgi:hypothetical protein
MGVGSIEIVHSCISSQFNINKLYRYFTSLMAMSLKDVPYALHPKEATSVTTCLVHGHMR